MIRNPKIGDMIREMAHSRSELTPNNQQGDMIAAELTRLPKLILIKKNNR
jgi:hypothetical protein